MVRYSRRLVKMLRSSLVVAQRILVDEDLGVGKRFNNRGFHFVGNDMGLM